MKSRSRGYDAFVALLADEGVDHVFGNPGTTELAIMQALATRADIRFVLGLHEGAVLAMADGFARASNRLTAANVHVAPGLGNAIGALYNAAFCGSPLIVTAGQQELGHGLMEPLLYGPLVEMARPLVKWAVEVTRVEDLPRILRRAAKVATAPPSGPVFVSLPGDILDAEAELEMGQRTRVSPWNRPSDAVIEALARRLLASRYPVIIAGSEVAKYEAWGECAALAEAIGAPVYQQTVPDAAHFPTDHRAYMGTLARNQKKVRDVLAAHDLLVSVGGDSLRMSVHSPVEALPEGMPVVHLSERGWDLGKNFAAEFALECNVRTTLTAVLARLREQAAPAFVTAANARLADLDGVNWKVQRARFAAEVEAVAGHEPIDPRWLMLRVAEALPEHAVVVEEALTATPALMSVVPYRDPKSFMGLAGGGIGFALPGAIGASLAQPGRPVVAVVGDGSAMYSVQALWTAAHLKLPVTYVILNNRSYRILKERMVAFRGQRAFAGMEFHDPPIDFTAMAQSMGVSAVRVAKPADVDAALGEAVASGAPRLVEVMIADGFGG